MGEMRDRRKTAAYFEAYIACEKRRLEKKLEKVKACTECTLNKLSRLGGRAPA